MSALDSRDTEALRKKLPTEICVGAVADSMPIMLMDEAADPSEEKEVVWRYGIC